MSLRSVHALQKNVAEGKKRAHAKKKRGISEKKVCMRRTWQID